MRRLQTRTLTKPSHVVRCRAVQQCDKRKKVTLTPEDILEALREAEFEDFEQPMKDALAQFRNGGGGAAKKGGNSAKKQKLDDSANGADTPTRPDQEVKEGEDEAEEAAGAAEGGAAPDDKMEEEADEDAAKDSADKDSDERVAEEKGKDDEEQDAAGGEGTDAPADNA
jgi:hypothetical protein